MCIRDSSCRAPARDALCAVGRARAAGLAATPASVCSVGGAAGYRYAGRGERASMKHSIIFSQRFCFDL
eukprot:1485485-Prymnesium_polylepis.1